MLQRDVGGGAVGGVSLEISETDWSINLLASTCPLRCDYYYELRISKLAYEILKRL